MNNTRSRSGIGSQAQPIAVRSGSSDGEGGPSSSQISQSRRRSSGQTGSQSSSRPKRTVAASIRSRGPGVVDLTIDSSDDEYPPRRHTSSSQRANLAASAAMSSTAQIAPSLGTGQSSAAAGPSSFARAGMDGLVNLPQPAVKYETNSPVKSKGKGKERASSAEHEEDTKLPNPQVNPLQPDVPPGSWGNPISADFLLQSPRSSRLRRKSVSPQASRSSRTKSKTPQSASASSGLDGEVSGGLLDSPSQAIGDQDARSASRSRTPKDRRAVGSSVQLSHQVPSTTIPLGSWGNPISMDRPKRHAKDADHGSDSGPSQSLQQAGPSIPVGSWGNPLSMDPPKRSRSHSEHVNINIAEPSNASPHQIPIDPVLLALEAEVSFDQPMAPDSVDSTHSQSIESGPRPGVWGNPISRDSPALKRPSPLSPTHGSPFKRRSVRPDRLTSPDGNNDHDALPKPLEIPVSAPALPPRLGPTWAIAADHPTPVHSAPVSPPRQFVSPPKVATPPPDPPHFSPMAEFFNDQPPESKAAESEDTHSRSDVLMQQAVVDDIETAIYEQTTNNHLPSDTALSKEKIPLFLPDESLPDESLPDESMDIDENEFLDLQSDPDESDPVPRKDETNSNPLPNDVVELDDSDLEGLSQMGQQDQTLLEKETAETAGGPTQGVLQEGNSEDTPAKIDDDDDPLALTGDSVPPEQIPALIRASDQTKAAHTAEKEFEGVREGVVEVEIIAISPSRAPSSAPSIEEITPEVFDPRQSALFAEYKATRPPNVTPLEWIRARTRQRIRSSPAQSSRPSSPASSPHTPAEPLPRPSSRTSSIGTASAGPSALPVNVDEDEEGKMSREEWRNIVEDEGASDVELLLDINPASPGSGPLSALPDTIDHHLSQDRLSDPTQQPPEDRCGVAKREFNSASIDYYNARFPHFTKNPKLHRAIFEAFIHEKELESGEITVAHRDDESIDKEGPPPDFEFEYSNDMLYHPDVPDPEKGLGCGCDGPCDPNSWTCTCLKRQQAYFYDLGIQGFAYDERGLAKELSTPIWECGDTCGCPPSCMNRVIQKGRKPSTKLEIFKTRKKGWGVQAKTAIPRGTFIGIYAGELITEEESEARGELYSEIGRTYLFDLDGWQIRNPPDGLASIDPRLAEIAQAAALRARHAWGDDGGVELYNAYSVDAFHYGYTRYFNHSCDPNLEITQCYVKDFHPERPLLVIFARRNIRPKEELCISYKGTPDESIPVHDPYLDKKGKGKGKQSKTSASAHVSVKTKKGEIRDANRCYCGAKNCDGKMFNL